MEQERIKDDFYVFSMGSTREAQIYKNLRIFDKRVSMAFFGI